MGWSQTNDNVFTGNPRPTYQQALHWPIMHPIDIICGTYTYQCMPAPFTLRDDDISGLDLLYPVGWGVPPGKTMTLARANQVQGTITFPSGQGMQGVNVVVHRQEPFWKYAEDWESVSAVSGYLFRRRNSNPVSLNFAAPSPMSGMGSSYAPHEGFFNLFRIPLYDWEAWQNVVVTTQPINPLYTGAYAVGPYDTNAVSALRECRRTTSLCPGPDRDLPIHQGDLQMPPAPVMSLPTARKPLQRAVSASGWWTGNLCSYGHAAWSSLTVQPNRTFTLEVTARDEQSLATTSKALPVMGVWNGSDPTGTAPSVATAPAAFNSTVSGMTTLSVQTGSGTGPKQLRFVIADQRGDGRPDYGYQARLFYADSIVPASTSALGGIVTIAGMGFRPGNTVTVNGVPATVTGWTANTITAVFPASHASTAVTADVTVRDLLSGATTTMLGAFSYAAPQPSLLLVSAPTGQVLTGSPANTSFTVQALQGDGVTPIAGCTSQPFHHSWSGPVRCMCCKYVHARDRLAGSYLHHGHRTGSWRSRTLSREQRRHGHSRVRRYLSRSDDLRCQPCPLHRGPSHGSLDRLRSYLPTMVAPALACPSNGPEAPTPWRFTLLSHSLTRSLSRRPRQFWPARCRYSRLGDRLRMDNHLRRLRSTRHWFRSVETRHRGRSSATSRRWYGAGACRLTCRRSRRSHYRRSAGRNSSDC